MKRLLGYGSCLAGGALLALAAQPVQAAATVITGVEVIPTDQGAQIVLETQAGETPQVFAVNQGNSLRADIVRTELQLTEGTEFIQQNPAPGISTISLVPLDSNSVRLTVDGEGRVPMGTVAESSNGGIVIDVAAQANPAPQASTPLPEEIPTVPGSPETVAQADDETDVPEGEIDAPEGDAPEPEGPEPDVLFPEPEVIIDGVTIPEPAQQQVAPPFLPAAVPPPVGDIAISETRPDFGEVDLGTAERVPRLVLREAPSREVLTLLARAADLNVVFVDAAGEEGTGDGEGPPITLDIEDESVQSVFNSVLRVTGLQANRVGRSIYVGPRLPNAASDVVIRTLRLNQIDVPQASNFLVGLGAERAVSREREVTTVTATEIAEGLEAQETQAETFTEEVLDVDRIDFQDSIPIFRGLQVVAEERTNSITLVGTPAVVELATAQLVRLDLRKRQVAINVKVIDIDLNALDAFGTSFSFEIGDAGFSSQGGVGFFNLGRNAPNGPTGVPSGVPITSITNIPTIGGGNGLLDAFLFQLRAVVEEGNAKILTDPTLIVQEGQSASVQLTEEIVAEFESDIEISDDGTVVTIDVETEPAGLILQIDVDRIDDNGFVSLSVAPSISAPVGQVDIPISGIDAGNAFVTLLSERQLNSGLVRVRDGQTLVLSGIIQETDRVSATKVPILGDLPIIGALFRSTIRENDRNELIVVLTPEILDDSDQSAFGYSYTPSEEVQNILDGINTEE